jgi:hypothetical protein
MGKSFVGIKGDTKIWPDPFDNMHMSLNQIKPVKHPFYAMTSLLKN